MRLPNSCLDKAADVIFTLPHRELSNAINEVTLDASTGTLRVGVDAPSGDIIVRAQSAVEVQFLSFKVLLNTACSCHVA